MYEKPDIQSVAISQSHVKYFVHPSARQAPQSCPTPRSSRYHGVAIEPKLLLVQHESSVA